MKGYTKIAVRTWYLEYTKEKALPPVKSGISVEKWAIPQPKEYLELYNKVGKDYGWSGRLTMEKNQLEQMLQKNENVHVFLYLADNAEAGYFEIDFTKNGEAEIVYLGLLPDFIGKGFGKSLIHEAVRAAYDEGVSRVWLHTCEYDHPHALELYQKAGFHMYDEKMEEAFYPDNHPAVTNKS